jgi:hypothetical protein
MNWEKYFDQSRNNYFKKSSTGYGTYRQEVFNKDYNTQLMLGLYTADYLALGGKLSDQQIGYINKLVYTDRRPGVHNDLRRVDKINMR